MTINHNLIYKLKSKFKNVKFVLKKGEPSSINKILFYDQ